MKYKYTVWCSPDENLAPLHNHFSQYEISASFKASTLMSDGGEGAVPGFPVFTLLGFVGNIALAAPAALVTPGGAALIVAGAIIDALLHSKIPDVPPPPPYPLAKIVQVTFDNVSAKRIKWAEYILCKICAERNWQILTPLRHPRNSAYAERSTKAPVPWSQHRPAGKSHWLWHLF